MNETTGGAVLPRSELVARALRLEYLTVGWNIVEGAVAVGAAAAVGSVVLLGFGIDSFVESASAGILIWRLQAESGSGISKKAIEALDRRAHRFVGLTFYLLAAYIAFDALITLWRSERPETSLVGMAVTTVSIGVMWWLAREKRRTAHALGSRALEADSFQTTACWWLSFIVLAGVGLNGLFGWWWADPLAALGMTWFLVSEGREAWAGDDCCD